MKTTQFDDLSRDAMLRLLLEKEDELRTLRPPPAKFKQGQVLAYGPKNPWMRGQPTLLFVVLSVENRNGEWYYGHSQSGTPHVFNVYPEKKLRAMNSTEIDGSALSATETVAIPQPTIVGHGLGLGGPGGPLGAPIQAGHGLHSLDVETADWDPNIELADPNF